MQKPLETFPEWDRNTRGPNPLPPPKSCDAQIHIYEDPKKYPTKPNPLYSPPDATFADGWKMLRKMGFERAVIVHATVYGPDHRLLIDTLESLPDRSNVRATAIVEDSTTDAELERLHGLGVRGARLNISRYFKMALTRDQMDRTLSRLKEIGWHARLHVMGEDLLEYSQLLNAHKDLTFVIDHMGHIDFAKGLDNPVFQWIVGALRNENWWMMLSNGNRISKQDSGWDDAIPFGKAYIEAAPDRMVWGTDWPHVEWRKRMMNDAEPVELFYKYVDMDKALIQKILVDNPARLFDFS